MSIKVAIIDDQDIIRLGVQQSLGGVSDIALLGEYADVDTFCQSTAAQRADVVLLDDSLPDMSLLEALVSVQACCPTAAVLVLGSRLTQRDVHRAIEAGASGVVCKQESLRDVLLIGIRHVHHGHVYLSPEPALLAGRIRTELVLSPRLDQVLHLVARGRHVQEMAHELGISTRAIYNARTRLREILEVASNEQIVAEAMRRGLLREED
ncbi:MAG: response regulator transcription factor [Chloroflexi bacterium]|nr:response regulator transcription factor [Chloroflexota bacterium]